MPYEPRRKIERLKISVNQLYVRLHHWLDQAIGASVDKRAMPYGETLGTKTVDEGKS